MKTYQHKLYDISGNLLFTIPPSEVIGGFSVQASINSGVAKYGFELVRRFDSEIDENAFILTVTEFSDDQKDGWLVFAGSLDSIQGVLDSGDNVLRYSFGGLHRLLGTQFSTKYSGIYQVDQLMQIIVDDFNAKQAWTGGALGGNLIKNGITDTTSININQGGLKSPTYLEVIIDLMKTAGMYFFVKPDGTIVGGKKPTTPSHRFTTEVDINNLQVDRVNVFDIRNVILVEGEDGGIDTYEDAGSIALYGRREEIESVSTNDMTQKQDFANTYLAENAFGQREIQFDAQNRDLSNIFPGDTLELKNSELDNVNNLQIIKTEYDGNIMRLYVEKYTSLAKLIKG